MVASELGALYLNLSVMALQYLGCPATSASALVERIFSGISRRWARGRSTAQHSRKAEAEAC